MATNRAQVAPVPEETDLQRFERELRERHQGRTIARFDFPSRIREARAIYIKEINSRDEIEAAKLADAQMSDLEKRSIKLTSEAERRETVRIACVGLVTRGEPIQYKHLNGSMPWMDVDNWSVKAVTCLSIFYGNLNGIPNDEIAEGLKGQRIIGGPAAPTNETPPDRQLAT